jgi:hypothetical protein
MRYQRLFKLLVAFAGAVIAAMGGLTLAVAAFGGVSQGRAEAVLGGIGFLLVAAPAIAVPFSTRLARYLLVLALACFAAFAIKLAFWPQSGVTPAPAPAVQAAAMAFSMLLVLRVYLGRRSKRAGHRP